MRANILCQVCAVVLLLGAPVFGGSPLLINYQGLVTDNGGIPLNGDFVIVVRIYNDSSAGSLLWQETNSNVSVSDGLFLIVLGNNSSLTPDIICNPDDAPSAMKRFLEIEVAGDGPISPRQQLVSSPYSASSYRVAGDIVTDSGTPVVPDPATAEKVITLDASKARMVVARVGLGECYRGRDKNHSA